MVNTLKRLIKSCLLESKRVLSNLYWRPAMRLSGGPPVPPRSLLVHVTAQNNIKLFLRSGESIRLQMSQALDQYAGASFEDYGDILDFGVGCGRITRWLDPAVQERLTGVDVSQGLIDFCARHLKGRYQVIRPVPAMPFEAGRFDLVIAFSVFSHMDRDDAAAWIAELHRVTREGAVLLITTHMEWCAENLLSEAALREYRDRGMCVIEYGAEGDHHQRYVSAFYTEAVWKALWHDRFELLGLGYGRDPGEFLTPATAPAKQATLPMGQALSVLRRR